MAPRTGHRGFLHLGDSFEEPRWREAIVIAVENEWVRTLVRASAEEIEKTELSMQALGESNFCLVEAELCQLRVGVKGEAMMLEADQKGCWT